MPDAGGVAVGFDRLLMLLVGAESIEDVLLFPAREFLALSRRRVSLRGARSLPLGAPGPRPARPAGAAARRGTRRPRRARLSTTIVPPWASTIRLTM